MTPWWKSTPREMKLINTSETFCPFPNPEEGKISFIPPEIFFPKISQLNPMTSKISKPKITSESLFHKTSIVWLFEIKHLFHSLMLIPYLLAEKLGGGGGEGVSESMDGWMCAILALEFVPKNVIFT